VCYEACVYAGFRKSCIPPSHTVKFGGGHKIGHRFVPENRLKKFSTGTKFQLSPNIMLSQPQGAKMQGGLKAP
jgi:hypothetical protein